VTARAPGLHVPLRTDIERALDELVEFEEGFRFQNLAVILAKQRWPGLIASEWKPDEGLDAHDSLPALGLATSITATLAKIKKDASRAQGSFPGLKTLIFYTSAPVTNQKLSKWQEEIRKQFDLELIVVPREDVIASLMDPANAPLCQSHLGLPIPVPETARDTLSAAMAACDETLGNWLGHYNLSDLPLIHLDLLHVADQRQDALDLAQLTDELRRGRRVVLEGPPGAGKTTTLLQLAHTLIEARHLCLVVDLPAWIDSGQDLLAFQARSPSFRSRTVTADGLAMLAASQPLVLLLNGWNEVGEARSLHAAQKLRALDREYPGAGILLATRTHVLAPPLRGAWHVAVQPLRAEQRRLYLSQSLGDRGPELVSRIAARPTLEELTRTPLILSEVVKLFEAGEPIPDTKLDILRAVAARIERSEEHQVALTTPPLDGMGSAYLEALALKMTKRGVVDLTGDAARTTIAAEASALRAAGQLHALPEPQSVLTALCAHHILQRLDGPTPTFRFQHQQFQEFYTALHTLAQLRSLLSDASPPAMRDFQRAYLNRPAWEEVLAMVAEAVGRDSPAVGTDAAAIGERLLRLSTPVDPLLAAALARSAGAEVWRRVGPELGALLRRWYASSDRRHRRCALAAMLLSGSEDFRDIIVPLLTDPDQQVRLGTYRAVERFGLSSLGSNWRELVATWNEAQRVDFVAEVLSHAAYVALAEDFATNDPSPSVRVSAIRALRWVGAHDALSRALEGLAGDELLEATSRGSDTESLPEAARVRLQEALRARAEEAHNAAARIPLLHRLVQLGNAEAAARLRDVLDSTSEAELRNLDNWMLLGVVRSLRSLDSRWTDAWITHRLADGQLWPDHWLSCVDEVPAALSERILEHISQGELDHKRLRGASALLSHAANGEIARRLWQHLIEIHPPSETEANGRHDPARSAVRRQLEDAVRNLPAPLRVSSALQALSSPPQEGQTRALLAVFGQASEEEDLRSELPDTLVRSLRDGLVALIPFVLREHDFSGSAKAYLAVAIGRVCDPSDALHICRLIDADIRRVSEGVEALRRREEGPRANGARTRWSHWYVKALAALGADAAESPLLDLLKQSGYENDAAHALARLVTQARPLQEQLRAHLFEPGSDPPKVTDEPRRARYARAVREYVQHLLEARNGAEEAARPAAPIKSLARTLAWLDGRDSRDLVLRVMALPGEWDGWTRTEALEQLLRVHRRLPTEATFSALNPTIEHMLRQGIFQDQHRDLVKRCLSLLALVDDPKRGIARIREVLAVARLRAYELRDLALPVARNGSEQALALLIEIADAAGDGLRAYSREWIAAVAQMALPRARAILMACVDPRIDATVPGLARFPQEVAEQIAQLAQADRAILTQIRESCVLDPTPVRRDALAHVVELLPDEETVLAALALIRDDATPPLPFELVRAVESVVLGREPYGGSAYTLVPRSGATVRSRLFAMVLEDPLRRRAAFSLLGQIEEWRLEHGRPLDEPRHPDIGSGLPWPPLALAEPLEGS
jgi:hypothetical protein